MLRNIKSHQTVTNDKGQMTNDDPNELALFVPSYLVNLQTFIKSFF